MGRLLNNEAAEREANKIAFQFQNSNDVIRDMSRAYNADFSNIRIHTDESADAKVRSAGRDAIASGNDLFFGKGIYESKDPASNALVAHELVHTMQQGVTAPEGTVSESAPQGSEQGGLLSWLKRWYRKRKIKKAINRGESPYTDEERAEIMANLQQTNGNATQQPRRQPVRTTPSDNKFTRNDLAGPRRMAMLYEISSQMPSEEEFNTMGNQFSQMKQNSDSMNDVERALVGLAPRDKGGKAADAEQALRNKVFYDSRDAYEQYIHSVDNYGSQYADYNEIVNSSETWREPYFGEDIMTGEYFQDLSTDVMNMLGKYLKTDEGMKYLSFMTEGIKDAKVFKDGHDTPLNYMLNTVFTGELGKFSEQLFTKEYVQNNPEAVQLRKQVFLNVGKNVQILPRMARVSEEERKTMPEAMQNLYKRYVRLEEELQLKMNEYNTKKSGS